MRKSIASFVAFSIFIACALLIFKQPAKASPPDAKAKALMALDDEWSRAAQAGNLDAVASYYAEDAVAYPPDAPKAVGRNAAREVWKNYFAAPNFKISWKSNAAGVDGKMGWTSGTYELSMNGPDGKPVSGVGKYLCVWRKGADGKWKAIHDMWNADSK